ncbi:T9SS type A sorting domain-containing protein [Puia dinghuensis]|uniref:T9SS C-terminal target domain-containing protein n=1 Tax=Puia dinghuensis TaxID=1792502 RepID=A0A8J2XUY9_9BACT|nr:T9SS type A sorting domain-containing protein [Puia dinghuensis]GGB13801.1 hypothetical protein GCM10011511_41910 [Puia dinghuensis]
MKNFLSRRAALPKRCITFFIILFCTYNCLAQSVDYGKSYVNITKGVNGGTIEPGDTLEIRATFVVTSGTAKFCSFTDNVPTNTTYLPGTLRILTNEGVIYQQFTDAADGDAGTIAGGVVTINMGTGANAGTGGSVARTGKPSFYGNACIMVAAYRVVINAIAYGTRLFLGGGILSYTNSGGTVIPITFPADSAIIHPNYGICSNVVGANVVQSEFGGTFGSGNTKDRSASVTIPATYTFVPFSSSAGMPNDYYYGISNNTSGGTTVATGYTTSDAWPFPDNSSPSHRIFNSWDIIGDHTGAPTAAGNPPTDDLSGQSGGYMAVINSSYRTDITFVDTVKNLCPLTEYSYSAWFRNMCVKCGCDSNGTSWSSPGYHPQAPGDSTGVHPNLTFAVDGLDYYTTGGIPYSGLWVQKGLVYHTRAGQTSMIITIRNNAPGGGGNDWAIDDISVATCSPNASLVPNSVETVCSGTMDTVGFSISSTFHVYNAWQMQKSTDGGLTWASPGNDSSGLADHGTATLVFDPVSSQYAYTISRNYGLNLTDTSIQYRIILASDTSYLSGSSCSFTGQAVKIVRTPSCLVVLPVEFLSFTGVADSGYAQLHWTAVDETGYETYTVERSDDDVTFMPVGSLHAKSADGTEATYALTDTRPLGNLTYYRVGVARDHYRKYSQEILLGNAGIGFEIKQLSNPFSTSLPFVLTVPQSGRTTVRLLDMYGNRVRQENLSVARGINNMGLSGLGNLPAGVYALQVQYQNKEITRQVIKLTGGQGK